MSFLAIDRDGPVAIVTLQRGKVNPLNEPLVEELTQQLSRLESDGDVRAIILTGRGKFFSFGFDIPELMSYSKDDFVRWLTAFTGLYTAIFSHSKPIIAALNGHTIAGGCMLAIACDHRIMIEGRAKISLNEITFGSTVFAGSVEILQYVVGPRTAETILYSGAMYTAEEALKLRLIDQVSAAERLMDDAGRIAREFAQKDPAALASMKRLTREPMLQSMRRRESDSIREFADQWYTEATRGRLREIPIRD